MSENRSLETTRPRRWKRVVPPRFDPWATFKSLGMLSGHFDLLLTLSLHRIKVRYKQSALGILWAILQPALMMVVYTVVFSIVASIPSEGMPYSLFVFAALLPWTFFSNSLTGASNCLVAHNQLITKVYFPREILPLTYVIAGICDLLFAGLVLVAMMLWFQIAFTWTLLWVIPISIVMALFTFGLSLILSILQASYRDIGLAMPLLMQLWMFASLVVYPLSSAPEKWQGYFRFNPMAAVVENFRRVVVQGQPPDLPSLAVGTVVTLILLPAAYAFFKYREATLADVI